MFRCFFGTKEDGTDPEYEIPTSDCLATTGTSMFTESKKHIGSRLPARTIVQGHGRDKEIVVLHIEQTDEFRGMIPKSSDKSYYEYDDRHITRADLPFATIGVFHIHPSLSHGAAKEYLQNEIMPLVTLYRCDAITGDEHLQQTPACLQSNQRSREHPHESISEIVECDEEFATRAQNGVYSGDFVHPEIHCPSSPVHEMRIRF